MAASIHVIPQEEVVVLVDISLFTLVIRKPKVPEESHQVTVLPMDISKHLARRLDVDQNVLFLHYFSCLCYESLNVLNWVVKLTAISP